MGASDAFEVNTATLRGVANQLGGKADEADTIAQKAKSADVATHSWGLLGLSLGLYANYTSARNTADRSIGEVKAFLGKAETAVNDTARDYDDADAAAAKLFAAIERNLP